MTSTPTTPRRIPDDLFARAQTITGLRQLADYLEGHPDLPVNTYGFDLTVYPQADTDAAERAEIDQIADLLAVSPTDNTPTGGHYTASKTFGRISYRAVHIPTRAWNTYIARKSYEHNIGIHQNLDQDREQGEAAA